MTTKHAAATRPNVTNCEHLLAAALKAFSTTGFNGTSIRQIERMAGVERGRVSCLFGSKQALWNAAVDDLFRRYNAELDYLRVALRDISAREGTSAMLMAYARFAANNPELFRILVLEGYERSERSERLGEHMRRALATFNDLSEVSRPVSVPTAVRWFQVMGAAGTLHSLAAHATDTFGGLLHDPEFVDHFAASLTAIALADRPKRPIRDFGYIHFLGDAADGTVD